MRDQPPSKEGKAVVLRSRAATPPPSGSTAFEAQRLTESVRETTKWLIAAVAGVGALLVAGLQLSDLSRVTSSASRALAILAVLAALGLMGIVVFTATTVFMDSLGSPNELYKDVSDRRKKWTGATRTPPGLQGWLDKQIRRIRRETDAEYQSDVLAAADAYAWQLTAGEVRHVEDLDLSDAYDQLQRLDADLRELDRLPEESIGADDVAQRAVELNGKKGELEAKIERYSPVLRELVAFLNYRITKRRFSTLRIRLFVCSLFAAILLGFFAWIVNPSASRVLTVTEPVRVMITIHDDDRLKELFGRDCTPGPLTGVAIGGTFEAPEIVAPDTVAQDQRSCTAAHVVLEKEIGVAVPVLE